MDAQIPAICEKCGKISFNVSVKSNADIQNAEGNYLCPFCQKGQAFLRFDVYKIINNLVDDIQNVTPERLVEIKGLLNQYNNPVINNLTFNGISSEIVDKAPELKSLKDLVPKTRMEAYAVIGIFLTIVTIVLGQLLSNGKVDKQSVLNEGCPKPVKNTAVKKVLGSAYDFKLVSRNEKCTCGSGKKYKYCHGIGK